MNDIWAQISEEFAELLAYLPRIIGALAILIVGYIVARLLRRATRSLLAKADLDHRLGETMSDDPHAEEEAAREMNVESMIATGVYYLALIGVAVLVFQTLALTQVIEPLNVFLTKIIGYLPNIIGPAILLLVAWVLATVLRALVTRGLHAANVDQRFDDQFGSESPPSEHTTGSEVEPAEEHPAGHKPDSDGYSLADTAGEISYWFVFLLFLPAILDGLQLGGLLAPVQQMVNEFLAFLPNLIAAVVIFAVGYFIARFIQQITASFLNSIGTDRLAARMEMEEAMGETSLSELIGYVVFALILLPVAVAALNALQITAVTEPAAEMLTAFLDAIPDIFAATLVVAIAYAAGRLLGSITETILDGVGFDRLPKKLGLTETRAEADVEGRSPSHIAGLVVFAGVLLLGTLQGFETLGFETLAALVGQFTLFAGNILLGLAVFAIGLYLAQLASRAIRQSRIANAGIVATIAQASIIVLTAAMALREMGIANEIINLAFGLGFGAIAVAAAIAFGLGGREPAGDLFREAVDRFRSSGPTKAGGPPEGPGAGGGGDSGSHDTSDDGTDRPHGE